MTRTCLSLAVALLVAAGGIAPAAAHSPGKRLIRIHTAGPNDLGVDNTLLAHEFANQVNAKVDTLEVKVFANSQLGQSREVIEAMRLGSGAAGTSGGPAEYASFVKRVGVLGLPFLWKSYDHATTVLKGEVGKALDQDMQKAGFKVLAWSVSWGYRNVVTAKKEVTKPEDLKGLKIRTIPTKVFVAAINAMGANATPMNFGEIYTSLQSGVLDGYEHTAATTVSFKLNEVAEYYSEPAFGQVAAEKVRSMAPAKEKESLEAVKKLGMKVNDLDTAPLQKAAMAAQDELAKDFGAESLLATIRKQ